MKKFIKGRWFPLAVTGVCVLALVLILLCLGFRITYAPKLENSWDAVSAVAAWGSIIIAMVSAFASFAAVWYAIKIADKQNKIALFEKQYKVYKVVKNCSTFAEKIRNISEKSQLNLIFLVAFDGKNILSDLLSKPFSYKGNDTIYNAMSALKYQEILGALEESTFLFPQKPKLAQYIEKIAGDLLLLLVSLSEDDSSDYLQKKELFVSTIDSPLYEETLQDIINELRL